ncbi:MAG: FMN-binding protein [Peptococcaceae bacterium]|nr:FMN-binding protein [Peptococcaceae bacterium]
MSSRKFKRLILLVSILTLIVMLAACGSSANTSAGKDGYKDGTYEGVAKGVHGDDLKVSVKVVGGEISEVAVVSHNESPGIGTIAIEEVPPRIVEAQSTEVDGVGGASETSRAIMEAVNSALEQAK